MYINKSYLADTWQIMDSLYLQQKKMFTKSKFLNKR